jgi:hypothetical protein
MISVARELAVRSWCVAWSKVATCVVAVASEANLLTSGTPNSLARNRGVEAPKGSST